jgi:hypothetical protein
MNLKLVGIPLAAALAACSYANDATSPVTNAAAAQDAPVPATCPSSQFDPFLKAFMANVEVQRAFTEYPYEATSYDPSEIEAGPTTRLMSATQVQFPVMLDERELAKHGAHTTSEKKANDWYQVQTHSEGSGAYSMTFNFRFRRGCWYLTDSVDAST